MKTKRILDFEEIAVRHTIKPMLTPLAPILVTLVLKTIALKAARLVAAMCAAAFLASTAQAEKLEYRYELKEGKGKPVCEHMTGVFNEKFRAPWVVDYALQWVNDPSVKDLGESRTIFG